MSIEFVFCDIGGTLGEALGGSPPSLKAFPSTAKFLTGLNNLTGRRVGVITTLGPLKNADGWKLLETAGLTQFIDEGALISEHDCGEVAKPDPAIYKYAAERIHVPIEKCLFVGENLLEVVGALTAGMQAILKPCPPGRELPT